MIMGSRPHDHNFLPHDHGVRTPWVIFLPYDHNFLPHDHNFLPYDSWGTYPMTQKKLNFRKTTQKSQFYLNKKKATLWQKQIYPMTFMLWQIILPYDIHIMTNHLIPYDRNKKKDTQIFFVRQQHMPSKIHQKPSISTATTTTTTTTNNDQNNNNNNNNEQRPEQQQQQ